MPQSRKSQINLMSTPYYHCISRCVRRAYLCGKDKATGKSYEHRRQWVEDKLLFLAQIFAIQVCAYAVMSNHTHVVLHVDKKATQNWTTKEILSRWHHLFNGTLLTQSYVNGELLTEVELLSVEDMARIYQERLCDISWFMRALNEPIARKANKEDECTGRFWEGRFKCQALLDERALLACMSYVDLNPIRAGIAKTPEESDYTSIKRRMMRALKPQQQEELMAFSERKLDKDKSSLPFDLTSYIELVSSTARSLIEGQLASIVRTKPNLLSRYQLSATNWLIMNQAFTKLFHGPIGEDESLTAFCELQGKKRRSNLKVCQRLLA